MQGWKDSFVLTIGLKFMFPGFNASKSINQYFVDVMNHNPIYGQTVA